MLEVLGLEVRLPSASRQLLSRLDLRLAPTEIVGLAGRSGSGKSTLLHILAGLVPWLRPAEVHGTVQLDGDSLTELDPAQRAHLLATCLDRPAAQLFLATPRQELAAAFRLHGPSALAERLVDLLGVAPLLDRRLTELSSGEGQRVALAVALAASPHPVLLDEPSAHLDAEGAVALSAVLAECGAAGGSVLLAEQAGWRLGTAPHRWLHLARGSLTSCPAPAAPALPAPAQRPGQQVLLRTNHLAVARARRRLLSDLDLELHAGEVVLISGPNGSGKSTLALALAGFHPVEEGRVERLGGRPALMLPQAELQLLAPSVAGELRAVGADTSETARVLRRHRLDHLAARAPWTLSRGERQRLVHATLDVLQPQVCIVDEPGQGLDPEDLEQLVHLIHRRAEKGRAYLVISHRAELARAAHRWLEIHEGRLVDAVHAGGTAGR